MMKPVNNDSKIKLKAGNKDRLPSWDNFDKIWKAADKRLQEIPSIDGRDWA